MHKKHVLVHINVAEQSSVAAPGMYEGAKNLVVVGFILDSNMGRRAKNFEMKFVLDLNSGAVKTTLDFHEARLARSFGVVTIIFASNVSHILLPSTILLRCIIVRGKQFGMGVIILDLKSGAVKITFDFHKARLARSFGVAIFIFDLTRFFRFKREKIRSAFHDVLLLQDVYQMLGTFH